ncbi:MAG: hypothetical protein CL843_19000 [Crocinitomicaceae bacterium]|nr:hypothetical protein [Crocinitomicaceae bacterium]|tara:strand:- start:6047 stop:6442 length:396 start_codon:yes stop_codon:yes gene_type:complete
MLLFKRVPVLIQFSTNKIKVTRLDTSMSMEEEAKKPFSNTRIIIMDFMIAEKMLRMMIKALIPPKFIFQTSYEAVIQQLEEKEGGVTEVERRAFRDLAEHSGAIHVCFIDKTKELTLDEAIEELAKSKLIS